MQLLKTSQYLYSQFSPGKTREGKQESTVLMNSKRFKKQVTRLTEGETLLFLIDRLN